MRTRPRTKIGIALLTLGLVVAATALLGFGGDAPTTAPAPAASSDTPAADVGASTPVADAPRADRRPSRPRKPVPALTAPPARGPSFELVHLTGGGSIPLRERPRGAVVDSVGPETEFGSDVVMSVVRKRGPWLGVLTPLLPNGKVGWIRFDPGKMERLWTKYVIRVDISRQKMTVRYSGTTISRHTVTVGAIGSETPTGRFAVTDALDFGNSPAYGCCALALNGHQPQLPVGWLGGDRLAIHGTLGAVGGAESFGCVRATNATMQMLFDRVPLGTPVFISA